MKNIRNNIFIVVFVLIQIVPITWMGIYLGKNEDKVENYYSDTVPSYDADYVISEKSQENYILIERDYCNYEYPNELYSNNCMVSFSMVKFKNHKK
jgi:hypothetical protein